jgi:hypothetical protein
MRIPVEDVEEFEARRTLMRRARQGDHKAKATLLALYNVTIFSGAELPSGGSSACRQVSRGPGGVPV